MTTPALTFEHIVRVNDLDDSRIEPLSRRQLWRGLVRRAELPRYFMPWIEHVDLVQLEDGSLQRVLDFGTHRVRDHVRFVEEECVRYDIEQGGAVERASVLMQIEEPAPGQLFVRFIYEIASSEHRELGELVGFVKDAYRQADEQTVAGIRLLAASCALHDREAQH